MDEDGARSIQRRCPGECRPIALADEIGVGLKCDLCLLIHKGGLRGFRSMGKLGACRMLAVVYAIITGVSYRSPKAMGIKIAPGTWTGR